MGHRCSDCKYEPIELPGDPCYSCVPYGVSQLSMFVPKKETKMLNLPPNPFTVSFEPLDTPPVIDSFEAWDKYNSTKKEAPETGDIINKPSHYVLTEGLEVRDVITLLVEKIEVTSYPLFISDYVQLMQYLMRFMSKNGKQDLEKARWYLDKLIEAYE